jgi:hypothetical protein
MTKREAFEKCLSECYEVVVLVMPAPGVDVPAQSWVTSTLEADGGRAPVHFMFLRYGLDMAKPIPDLEITDDGIRATLSFSCEPVKTFVPWAAVAGIQSDGERPKQREQLRAV